MHYIKAPIHLVTGFLQNGQVHLLRKLYHEYFQTQYEIFDAVVI